MMKKGILFLFLAGTITTNAQSLKDALYGGKLKTDSGTVIRKTDDLSNLIDTASKVSQVNKTKSDLSAKDSTIQLNAVKTITETTTEENKPDTKEETKDNDQVWSEFMETELIYFNDEILTSKKIKSGTYYIMVDYEIDTEGQVNIMNIYPAPENKFLAEQIKERLTLTAPDLSPILTSTGKPRKVNRKYNFTLTKE
jgi:hypothetical protein